MGLVRVDLYNFILMPQPDIRTRIVTIIACPNKAWQSMGSQLYGWWKRCILFFNQKPLKGLCGLDFSLVDVLSCSSPTAKHLIWVQIISSCSYHLHLFFFFLIAKLHTPSMSRIHNLIFPSHALLTGNELWGRMFFFFLLDLDEVEYIIQ